jgi:hypothetical protein
LGSPLSLLPDRNDLEMARTLFVCLRDHSIRRAARLEHDRARYVSADWPKDHDTWQNLVAILGTTISPYLFFWQSSQEVEHEKSMGRRMLVQREGATKREIIDRKLDVGIGTFFSKPGHVLHYPDRCRDVASERRHPH